MLNVSTTYQKMRTYFIFMKKCSIVHLLVRISVCGNHRQQQTIQQFDFVERVQISVYYTLLGIGFFLGIFIKWNKCETNRSTKQWCRCIPHNTMRVNEKDLDRTNTYVYQSQETKKDEQQSKRNHVIRNNDRQQGKKHAERKSFWMAKDETK